MRSSSVFIRSDRLRISEGLRRVRLPRVPSPGKSGGAGGIDGESASPARSDSGLGDGVAAEDARGLDSAGLRNVSVRRPVAMGGRESRSPRLAASSNRSALSPRADKARVTWERARLKLLSNSARFLGSFSVKNAKYFSVIIA